MRDRPYYVYILTNKRNGTLYIGVTSNIVRRIYEHKLGLIDGFSKKYGTSLLVYYDKTPDVLSAITKEKQLKKWNRAWKIRIIEEINLTGRIYP